MSCWPQGNTLVIRNIARSDGTVTTATPAIVIQDDDLLALYIPKDTPFKNNWVVPTEERAASVENTVPSAQRQYRDLYMWHDSLRLYLPGRSFSVGLTFDNAGQLVSWYGNLEAPFVRTRLGIDTRDHALDVVAYPDGRWHWKDEEEFARRLAVGLDSAKHQVQVRAAGQEFIDRFARNAWPFNMGWQAWRPRLQWPMPILPEDWATDLGSHKLLT